MKTKTSNPFRWLRFSLLVVLTEIVVWSLALFFLFVFLNVVPNFRFENEWVLSYLIPALVIFISGTYYVLFWKQKMIRRIGKSITVSQLFGGYSTTRLGLKYLFWRLGIFFLFIAAANPQFGEKEIEIEASGIEIMIALDVSNSMLAEDLAPNYSRLKVAKLAIEKLINQLNYDRIGLVVFAGAAYKHLPITHDYNAAKLFLQSVNTDMITAQGTDIGNAIETSLSGFDFENGVLKTILLFTDGEDHEAAAVEAAKKAQEKGVIIHTIGMGNDLGTPIPVVENGVKKGFKKDADGTTVLTKINEPMLIELASVGGGSYTRANGLSVGVDGLLNQLNTINKSTLSKAKYKTYDDQFQLFLILGIGMFLLDLIVVDKRNMNTRYSFNRLFKRN